MSLPPPSLAFPLPTVWNSSPVLFDFPPLTFLVLVGCFLSDPGRLLPESAVMLNPPSSLSYPDPASGAACELIRLDADDLALSRLVFLFEVRGVVAFRWEEDTLLRRTDFASEEPATGAGRLALKEDEPRGAADEVELIVVRPNAGLS